MVKSRPQKDLKRRQSFKAPNKAELIVCEGSATEPQYFNALRRKLRLHAIQIDVVSTDKSEPIDVVEYAISKKKDGAKEGLPYSKVWCVIDVEIPPHKTLDKAWEKAATESDFELILSNPFFEYWLLLHFEKITAPFNEDKDLHRALRDAHPSYKKSNIHFDVLYPRTDTAIKHSKETLKANKCSKDLREQNPSTHVHIVVRHLQNIAQR